ncbi:hypothetical protein [Silvibacterium acidisoli]|uniref:hypothetical protein n=1 Tax=Acidobacteriaceae bacterium ZG23-2 TaxID=2883246 RepID=UPI00406C2A61
MITSVGRLYEGWNVWEIEDLGHVARAMARMIHHLETTRATEMLAEVVEYESIHYLDSLPFSPST